MVVMRVVAEEGSCEEFDQDKKGQTERKEPAKRASREVKPESPSKSRSRHRLQELTAFASVANNPRAVRHTIEENIRPTLIDKRLIRLILKHGRSCGYSDDLCDHDAFVHGLSNLEQSILGVDPVMISPALT